MGAPHCVQVFRGRPIFKYSSFSMQNHSFVHITIYDPGNSQREPLLDRSAPASKFFSFANKKKTNIHLFIDVVQIWYVKAVIEFIYCVKHAFIDITKLLMFSSLAPGAAPISGVALKRHPDMVYFDPLQGLVPSPCFFCHYSSIIPATVFPVLLCNFSG